MFHLDLNTGKYDKEADLDDFLNRQIKDNHYARPFQSDKRKLYLIGVNFSSETRTVEKWVVEEQLRH